VTLGFLFGGKLTAFIFVTLAFFFKKKSRQDAKTTQKHKTLIPTTNLKINNLIIK
jgi:hypothetical protein